MTSLAVGDAFSVFRVSSAFRVIVTTTSRTTVAAMAVVGPVALGTSVALMCLAGLGGLTCSCASHRLGVVVSVAALCVKGGGCDKLHINTLGISSWNSSHPGLNRTQVIVKNESLVINWAILDSILALGSHRRRSVHRNAFIRQRLACCLLLLHFLEDLPPSEADNRDTSCDASADQELRG